MKYLLSSAQMKQCDANTMEYYGIPSLVLMERASLKLSDEIMKRFPDRSISILSVCGTGNNGGDGIAAARLLFLAGYDVDILFPGNEEKMTEQTRIQHAAALKYNIPVFKELPEKNYDVIIDAIFGIGLDREVKGRYAELINSLNLLEGFKAAADIASGISANTGQVLGTAFKADLTVTFGFAKKGQILYPGAVYTGELITADIGIDGHSLLEIKPDTLLLESKDLECLPERSAYSNKGTYGKVLTIAGSFCMAGAAALSARASYYTGAGLVKIITPEENREIIQCLIPEAILSVYGNDTDIKDYIKDQLAWADAVVLGPGLGRSSQAEEIVKTVLANAAVPCIIDADALNIIAEHKEWLKHTDTPLIITPHPGEMSRLCGKSINDLQKDLLTAAGDFAAEYGVITVLKDAATVIALPFGRKYINNHGNNGMATAGSGDVLSGIIGALLGQGMESSSAAYTGVLIHAMAGDEGAKKTGVRSLTASGIAGSIENVLRGL